MPKEYVFVFHGTKETFLEGLDRFYNYNRRSFYFHDYIVELVGDEIRFGVERAGHSGGHWYVPTITEFDNRIEFCGTIQYIGPDTDDNRNVFRKAITRIGDFFLFIFILPIALGIKIYLFTKRCINRILKRPQPKEESTEDKLFDLMENYLKCTRQ